MKLFSFSLLLLLAFSPATFLKAQSQQNANTIFASPSLMKLQEKLKSKALTINTSKNPFYLRGDFNGDKVMDLAVLVFNQKNEKGLIIAHGNSERTYYIVNERAEAQAGADLRIPFGVGGAEFFWHALTNGEAIEHLKSNYRDSFKKGTKVVGEAISYGKMEGFGGVIYWDGKQYVGISGGC